MVRSLQMSWCRRAMPALKRSVRKEGEAASLFPAHSAVNPTLSKRAELSDLELENTKAEQT